MALEPRITEIIEYRYGQRASDTTITNQYLVTTSGADVSGYEVCRPYRNDDTLDTTATLPKLFDRFEVEGETTVFRVLPGGISAERIDDNVNQWLVTVTYTQTKMITDDVSDLKFGQRNYKKVAEGAYGYTDPAGTTVREETEGEPVKFPFKNSSKELYDPADTQVEFSSTILSFTLRQSDEYDYVADLDNRGVLNFSDVDILGFTAKTHQAKVLTVAPDLVVDEKGTLRWFTFYEIEIMPEGETHNIRLQNQGYYAKFPEGIREIKVGDINPSAEDPDKYVTKPRLLDADGSLRDDAESEAGFWEYRVYRDVEFATEFNFPELAVDATGTQEVSEGQL